MRLTVFHFWIGVTATIGALILVGTTLLTELRTREPSKAEAETGATRTGLALASRRNVLNRHAHRADIGANSALSCAQSVFGHLSKHASAQTVFP